MKSHELAARLLALPNEDVMLERWDGELVTPSIEQQTLLPAYKGPIQAKSDLAGTRCLSCGYPIPKWGRCAKCGHSNQQPSLTVAVVLR